MSDAEHFTRTVVGYEWEDNFLTGGRKHFAKLECGHLVHIPATHVDQVSALICPDCRDFSTYGSDPHGDGGSG